MSSIHVVKKHSMDLETAQNKADALAADLSDKFDVDYGWDGNTLVFSRSGVKGTIEVNADAVIIDARLGMFLFYMQPVIEQEINRYLAAHFA